MRAHPRSWLQRRESTACPAGNGFHESVRDRNPKLRVRAREIASSGCKVHASICFGDPVSGPEFRSAIPYPDQNFDLVFTSGVLIHIAPTDVPVALAEIHRCAKTWVWGSEYYAPRMTEVSYRGHDSLLWKTDYAQLYVERFPDLELVSEQRLRYLENENVDTMFLLRRQSNLVGGKV